MFLSEVNFIEEKFYIYFFIHDRFSKEVEL
jgi:hypothetical protein